MDVCRSAAICADHALDGIKLHPNNSGLALASDYNCAIFAFAQERHIPVAVHSYPNAEDDLSAAKRIVKTAEEAAEIAYENAVGPQDALVFV